MASSQNFFQKAVQHSSLALTPSTAFINVGGCGFRTLVEWLLHHVDGYLLHPRMKMKIVSIVLRHHFAYFPQHKLNITGLMTQIQCMKQLKDDVPEFADTLVYTLRRIAFDELCADPVRYRSAFATLNKATTLEAMFQSMTTLDESGLAALAKVLHLTIVIQDVEPCKAIYALTRYQDNENSHTALPSVVMQRQDDGYYMLRTTHSTPLSLPKSPLTTIQAPVPQQTMVSNQSMSDIHAKLTDEDDALRARFERAYAALIATDIKKSDLFSVYFKHLVRCTDSPCHETPIGTEHGNQLFFAAIVRQTKQPVFESSERYDEQITQELRIAIARAVSLGYLSLDDVHNCIDREEALATTSKSRLVM